MNILWNIHLYLPRHAAGAEKMAHDINLYLMGKGHRLRVIINQAAKFNVQVPYNFEGVDVIGASDDEMKFYWPDIIISHLEYTHNSVALGGVFKKPVVHIVHNDSEYKSITNNVAPVNVVYNSQWIADKLAYKHPSIVLHPPCDPAYYDVRKSEG